jgi:two-component system, OmpR family, response regulator VicR
MTILLVEDELLLARIVIESLTERGFTMLHTPNAYEARQLILLHKPDLLVLDVMLPHKDGFTFSAELRQDGLTLPILFLTAKNQSNDVVKGFESGGNDYLRKPFSMEELIVRIKELLRRVASAPTAEETAIFTIGIFTFDSIRQTLTPNTGPAQLLSHRESELLRRLCLAQNRVLPRKEVLLDLWGDDTLFNARSMDVFVTKLRRHFAADSTVQIVNIRGIGYKMIVP